jgi:hypothetical protein
MTRAAPLGRLNTARRTMRYLVGWTITEVGEQAVARLPATAWTDSFDQDGQVRQGHHVAELTALNRRTGWPDAAPGAPGPPDQPRPASAPEDRAHLALGPDVRPGLATPHPLTGLNLRTGPRPQRSGRRPARAGDTRRPRSDMRRPTPIAQGTCRRSTHRPHKPAHANIKPFSVTIWPRAGKYP